MGSDEIVNSLDEELAELDLHWSITCKGSMNWSASILTERGQVAGAGTGVTMLLAISAAVTNYYANMC